MKKAFYLPVLFCCTFLSGFSQSTQSLHNYTATTIEGNTISMAQYAGKKILIVNTASYCSYTPQFALLEQLYTNYKQYGFEIIGFPCNDFGSQDPHTDSTINVFCTNNYSVTFQMMSKVAIVAGDTAPVYRWLQQINLNGKQNVAVDWNFNKFLINEGGNWNAHHPSAISPLDTAITNWIMSHPNLVGLNKPKNETEFVTFTSANPTNSVVDFTLKESGLVYLITIYSLDGKLIQGLNNQVSTGGKISLDVSALDAGIYFLRIDNGLHQTNKKIIVSR